MGSLTPSRHQPKLPQERIILSDTPDEEAVPMDVLFVGGGPAGLAGAIELANLVKKDGEAGGELGEVEIGVDRDPPPLLGHREKPLSLIEAHGVDRDAAGGGELFDSVLHEI